MNYAPAIWLHVLSDLGIFIAYVGIPIQIVRFLRQQKLSIPRHYIFALFAAFILLCGLTHAMSTWTMLVSPDYVLEGGVKLATAIVSLITLVALIPALKYFGGFKDLTTYREANHDLRGENQTLLFKLAEQAGQLEDLQKLVAEGNRVAQLERKLLIDEARENIKRIESLIPVLNEAKNKVLKPS